MVAADSCWSPPLLVAAAAGRRRCWSPPLLVAAAAGRRRCWSPAVLVAAAGGPSLKVSRQPLSAVAREN